jgi:archaemetzincin
MRNYSSRKNKWAGMAELIIQLFCVIAFLHSCHHTISDDKQKENKIIVIDIQPFSGITEQDANYVFTELKKIYPKVELNKTTDLPVTAYNATRKRYRADSIINYLGKHTAEGHVTIGLTNKDVSTTKGGVRDWGVMGLGFCPGSACIASLYRLSKEETDLQLFKVAIHELGHTQGLAHCTVTTCFMRDAEGRNLTGEEKEFCSSCETCLIAKGWKFK